MFSSQFQRRFLLLSSGTALALASSAARAQETIVLDPVVIEGQAEAPAPARIAPATQAAAAGASTTGPASTGVETPDGATTAIKGAGSQRATPQSVSVVGREELETRNVQSVDEAVRYSAGIQGQRFGTNNRLDWFNIRGFPAEADGLFLDGLALYSTAFAAWQIEPSTLDRVEILRGPASVLYGGTSPGGIVNLVSKRPTKTAQGEVEVGINEFGQGYAALEAGGPLDDQAIWSYRLNTKVFGGDYYAEIGEEFEGVIAPSINWSPDADTSLTVYGYYQKDDSNNTPGFLPYVGTVVPAPYGFIDREFFSSDPGVDEFERDQAMVGYEFEHRFNDAFTVRQNLRYAHLESEYQVVYGIGPLFGGAPTQINRINFRTEPTADNFTVDTQGEARFETGAVDHVALAGVDYRLFEIDDLQAFALPAPIDVVNPDYGLAVPPVGPPYIDNTQTLSQTGLYVQDQMTYDQFVVTLNARYDFLDTELDTRILEQSDNRSDEGAVSGRAGAAYLFDNGLTPYVSYSSFFTPVLGTSADTGQPFESGDGEQIEGGVKYQPPGLGAVFTASVFDIQRRNVLTRDVVGGRPFIDVQTGEIVSQGFELEADMALGAGFSLLAAYTNLDLEVTESSGVDLGREPTATPEEIASLWLGYEVRSGVAKGLRLGAGVRYVGESFADRANLFEVPDYTLVDAVVSYETETWRAALNATNLFDERTVSCGPDENSCFYGDPRRVTASLAYKF